MNLLDFSFEFLFSISYIVLTIHWFLFLKR